MAWDFHGYGSFSISFLKEKSVCQRKREMMASVRVLVYFKVMLDAELVDGCPADARMYGWMDRCMDR
jgi:hypothetical protein